MNVENAIANTRCLMQACEKNNIKYDVLDSFGNWVRVYINNDSYDFINFSTPFNYSSRTTLVRDKDFTYRLFGKELKMATAKGYLDPGCEDEYKKYLFFKSIDEISEDMQSEFSFPFIVKMNSGTKGRNSFKVNNSVEIERALMSIYNKNSMSYDYIALAQQYIDIDREFRVVRFKDETILVYEKVFEGEKNGNLNPMFNEGSRAGQVSLDSDLVKRIDDFLNQSQELKKNIFCGIDLAIDKNNEMWLIEINSSPTFSKFARDNGDDALAAVYEKILKKI